MDDVFPRFSFPLQKAVEMAEKLGAIVNNLDLRDRSFLSMRFQKIKIEAAIKDAVDKTRDLLTKEGVSQDTIFPTARDLLISYGIGNPLDEKKWATISKALLKDCYNKPLEWSERQRQWVAIQDRPSPILYQTDPLENLLKGAFYTQGITLGQIRREGNFGLGTFDGFEGGEMLLLGGTFYSMPHPQTVKIAGDLKVHTPFAMVTEFREESASCDELADIPSYEALKRIIDSNFISDPSKHHAVMIHGEFSSLKTQCVQEPPNQKTRPFKEVPQAKGEIQQVRATLVGFRLGNVDPSINYSGYHFHGMTDDAALFGGHILDLGITNAVVRIQELDDLKVLRR